MEPGDMILKNAENISELSKLLNQLVDNTTIIAKRMLELQRDVSQLQERPADRIGGNNGNG